MKAFSFQNNHIELEFPNNYRVSVEATADYAKRVSAFGKQAQELGKFAGLNENSEDTLDAALVFLRESVDTLIEPGASARIFADRKENFFDYIDILSYLMEQINSFQMEKKASFSKGVSVKAGERLPLPVVSASKQPNVSASPFRAISVCDSEPTPIPCVDKVSIAKAQLQKILDDLQ